MEIEMTCLDTQSSTDHEMNRPVDRRRGEWETSKIDNKVLMTGVNWISEPDWSSCYEVDQITEHGLLPIRRERRRRYPAIMNETGLGENIVFG